MINRTITCAYLFLILIWLTAILMVVSNDVVTSCCWCNLTVFQCVQRLTDKWINFLLIYETELYPYVLILRSLPADI